jgi:hypothetical protein
LRDGLHLQPGPPLSADTGAPAVRATRVELGLLGGLLGFLLLAYVHDGLITPVTANVVAGLGVIAIMAMTCRALLAADPLAIWTPLWWLRVAYAAYYGFGALVPYIVNDATLIYMQNIYLFTDEDILKVNLINVLALIALLLGTQIAALHFSRSRVPRRTDEEGSLQVLAVTFLLVGGFARYGLVIPFIFGFGEGFLPSFVTTLGRTYLAGLMLLVIIALRRGPALLLLAGALIVIELLVGTLTFSKGEVLATILFVLLGVYHHRPSLARLGAGGAVAVVVFALLAPMIGYGREQATIIGGGAQIATLEQRWNILSRYMTGDVEIRHGGPETQIALFRLSYMNVGTMVVAWRDFGRRGGTFENALAAVVPRVLWPDKPDLSATGRNLYTAATGQEAISSISPGIPAELYWNFGWIGVPLLMLPVGIMFAILSRMAVNTMARERWLLTSPL